MRRAIPALSILLWAMGAHAQIDPAALTTFEAGTPIRSAAVNANFEHLAVGGATLGEQLSALAATVQAQSEAQAALTERVTAAEATAAAATTARDALADRLDAAEAQVEAAGAAALAGEAARAALAGRVETLEGERAALTARVEALEAQVAAGVETLSGRADTLDGRADGLDRRVDMLTQRADTLDEDLTSTQIAVDDLEDRLLVDRNLIVVDSAGGEGVFPDMQSAWAWLATRRIAADERLTIQVRPGVYANPGPLRLEHPDGGRISVQGDVADPGAVRFRFNGTDGVVLTAGHALGQLSGVTLDGEPGGGGSRGITGLRVDDGATLVLGRGVVVTRFTNGAIVRGSSYLAADSGFRLLNNSVRGLWVQRGSVANVPEVEVSESGQAGIICEHGSTLIATDCQLQSNGGTGATIALGAVADLNNCTVESNGEWGVLGNFGAVVRATSSTIQRNVRAGVQLQAGTYGSVSSSQLLGNNTGNGNGQAQLVVNRTAHAAIGGTFDAQGNGTVIPALESERVERPVSGENR